MTVPSWPPEITCPPSAENATELTGAACFHAYDPHVHSSRVRFEGAGATVATGEGTGDGRAGLGVLATGDARGAGLDVGSAGIGRGGRL